MQEEIILETERLYLRKFIPEKDAAYFLALVNSPGWLKYIGDRSIHDEAAAVKYINDRVIKGYADHGFGGYTIIEKSSGKPIGNAGLYKRPVLEHFDVGYALLPEFHGKGYAYEASKAVLDFAKKSGLKRVHAITVAYNDRSIHLLEKLGLKFEKTFRMEGDPEELSLYSIEL
jgi:[ribosomal protein S5]-alanine N-acetyltransferase